MRTVMLTTRGKFKGAHDWEDKRYHLMHAFDTWTSNLIIRVLQKLKVLFMEYKVQVQVQKIASSLNQHYIKMFYGCNWKWFSQANIHNHVIGLFQTYTTSSAHTHTHTHIHATYTLSFMHKHSFLGVHKGGGSIRGLHQGGPSGGEGP